MLELALLQNAKCPTYVDFLIKLIQIDKFVKVTLCIHIFTANVTPKFRPKLILKNFELRENNFELLKLN